MTDFIRDMLEYGHQVSLKWHMFLGFAMGAGPFSYFVDHWQDIVLAFIMGSASAFGAGLVKLIFDRYYKLYILKKRAKITKQKDGKSKSS